jgi:hypothetical protein
MTAPAIPGELLHFVLLDREQRVRAIRRLAASGMSAHGIAAATRLSVEQIQAVLGEPHSAEQARVLRALAVES